MAPSFGGDIAGVNEKSATSRMSAEQYESFNFLVQWLTFFNNFKESGKHLILQC